MSLPAAIKKAGELIPLLLFLCVIFFAAPVRAESEADPSQAEVQAEMARRRGLKQEMLKRLMEKLLRKDGQISKFVVFTPLDTAQYGLSEKIVDVIARSVRNYGNIPVEVSKAVVENLTLEELRKLIIRNQADILVTSSLKTASIDLYLYDSRTPYYIYAYSEPIPPEARLDMNAGVIPNYAKTAMRKLLFRYLQNQFFEIPRSDSAPVLNSDIPRWIASNESLALVQRDFASRYYMSVSIGAALAQGPVKSWTSNLVSGELGMRLYSHLFLEGSLESFAYNSASTSLKYLFDNRNMPFSFELGMGAALVTIHFSAVADPNISLGPTGGYLMPSASILLPLFDVYLKGETRLYLNGSKRIFSVMPGFLLYF